MINCPQCRRSQLKVHKSEISLFDTNRIKIASEIWCSDINCNYNKELSTFVYIKELEK